VWSNRAQRSAETNSVDCRAAAAVQIAWGSERLDLRVSGCAFGTPSLLPLRVNPGDVRHNTDRPAQQASSFEALGARAGTAGSVSWS